MNAEFKVTGDIKKVCKVLKQSVDNVDKVGSSIVESNSKIYYEALMDNILGQKLSWKSLTPGYAGQKGVLGLDTRVLIATGEYVENIGIHELKERGGKLRYHVGVDPDATHSSGLNMGVLSLILEYGTADGRIPARSHFGETWSQVRKKIRDNSLKYGREIWQMSK